MSFFLIRKNTCKRILNNHDWYHQIPADIIEKYNKEFYASVDSAFLSNIISKQTWSFIRNNFPKVPTFYIFPKIHKNSINPSGRPIISGIGSISDNASKLVYEFLRPHVTSLPSYVRDTVHLLQIIDELNIPDHALPVTIDVETLYSSIPHEKGLAAINHVLQQNTATDPVYNE